MKKRISFISPYPYDSAPSQRFRFEQYLKLLTKEYDYSFYSFYSNKGWEQLYQSGWGKWWHTFLGYWRRLSHLAKSIRCDYIFIHREMTPLGPPIFEWILTKVFNKKVIYDFDDAIWTIDHSEKNNFLSRLKWKSKVSKICKWSVKVSVGNQFLAEFARKYNQNIVINPTTIDTEYLHNPTIYKKSKITEKTVIGWTGSHSTLPYLKPILPVLLKMAEEHNCTIKIICNKKPDFMELDFEFIRWTKENEISDLMTFDIGIMPLNDDSWSKGKCGFKILQYMALQIPALASPVGVNTSIVSHGVNGFLCTTLKDWELSLIHLINNPDLSSKIGRKAREFVINNYSVESNTSNFLSLFEL